jgi:phosphoserine/homoserine phosphotransferase
MSSRTRASMPVVCLDLEGVLVPEIWINVARRTGIKELLLTTRDISDYDKLMRYRLKILKREGIRLADIQRVIARMRPLPGARRFLERLRAKAQVIVLSDTFYQFAGPLMERLGRPVLFCNRLTVARSGMITGYRLRQTNGKQKAVRALRSLGFEVRAAGDSYNDLGMLQGAHRGVLFRPPDSIKKKFRNLPAVYSYQALLRKLTA